MRLAFAIRKVDDLHARFAVGQPGRIFDRGELESAAAVLGTTMPSIVSVLTRARFGDNEREAEAASKADRKAAAVQKWLQMQLTNHIRACGGLSGAFGHVFGRS